ncbi:hypothetical protein HN903_02455 [archaeon]|jgi:hypothetical protein|nr:hypothetical protein [archaeon]MBT7128593.1 hypothetical protein [archaeon]
MDEKANKSMSRYYQEKKQFQESWQQSAEKYNYQCFLPDCLNEFSQEERTKIFNDVYSCINKFYQLVNNRTGC